jgi:hypothetical protein
MIYTVYNPDTFEVLYAQEFEVQPDNSTDVVCMDNFVKPKFNPQTNEYYEGATQPEVMAQKINDEYSKYVKRKADGEVYHLRICAELRVVKESGGMTQTQYDALYAATSAARNEIVNGQWLSGKAEIEKLYSRLSPTLYSRLSPTLYSRLLTDITTYINENY